MTFGALVRLGRRSRAAAGRCLPALLLLGLCAPAARAEDLVWAAGRVYDATGTRPLAGAMVAVYDDKNRVIDYAKTDAQGDFALTVPKKALHLGKKSSGFLYRVVGGMGRLVSLPLKAGIKAAAGVVSVSDPVTKAGVGAASNLAQALVDVVAPDDRRKKVETLRNQPGVLVMKVSMPGHNDAVSLARVYWMQEELYRAGGKESRTLIAWVDPAQLTPRGDEKPSTIESRYLTFSEARLEPSIAEPGQRITLSARLVLPSEPRTPVVVVARNTRTGRIYQLDPVADSRYAAEIEVDRQFPRDDQTFCIIAYPEQDNQPGRNRKVEDAINGAGLWNPEKPFVYNPLLVASRNRAEVVLTVVAPARR